MPELPFCLPVMERTGLSVHRGLLLHLSKLDKDCNRSQRIPLIVSTMWGLCGRRALHYWYGNRTSFRTYLPLVLVPTYKSTL